MPRGYFPQRVKNYTPWIKPVPAPAISRHDEEPARCIKISEVLIPYLLGMLELARYGHVFTGTDADRTRAMIVFQDLANALALEDYCEDCPDCSEDAMYLLRQNPNNPCQLQQSTDGGVNWSLAFDYRLCLIEEQTNPPLERFDPVTGNYQVSIDDGATWTNVPDARTKTPITTNIYASKPDPACWNAHNARELIRQMVEDSGDELIAIVSFLVQLLIVVLTGGAALPLLLTSIVTAILEAGIATARAQMTPERWDDFLRILYCSVDTDSGWSLEAFASIFDQVAAEFPFEAAVALQGMLSAIGWAGLNNAGHLALVSVADCSTIQCGELDCGFTTNSAGLNDERWSPGVDVFDPVSFYNAFGCIISPASPVMTWNGSQTLAAFTTFPNACYVTSVTLYTLGRSNSSRIAVAYKTSSGGSWHNVGTRTKSSWAAGQGEVFDINAPVVAIQVQSFANPGQNNFNTIVVGDPTP